MISTPNPDSIAIPRSVHFREQREASWAELEDMVKRAQHRGLQALNERELFLLPVRYREAMSSLSVARSTALDRSLILYLEALCARAYLVIYGSRRPVRHLFRSMFVAIPQAIRAIFREFWMALALFLLGVFIAWTLVSANPEWFQSFVPKHMSQGRDPWASTETLKKTLYQDPSQSSDGKLTLFASYLFTHNARIGIFCFALGIALGIPTAILLFYNGLVLGAFLALFSSRGLLISVLGWLLPHGVPEITAILLCGAAGLAIARAIMFPGGMLRTAALKLAGQQTAIVMIGAVLLFLLAALFEGYFRQLILDDTFRLLVAGSHLLGLSAWFLLTGQSSRESPGQSGSWGEPSQSG